MHVWPRALRDSCWLPEEWSIPENGHSWGRPSKAIWSTEMRDAAKASSATPSMGEFMSSFHSSLLGFAAPWAARPALLFIPVCSWGFCQTPALQVKAELRMGTRDMLEPHKVIELQTHSENAIQMPETFQMNRGWPELFSFYKHSMRNLWYSFFVIILAIKNHVMLQKLP